MIIFVLHIDGPMQFMITRQWSMFKLNRIQFDVKLIPVCHVKTRSKTSGVFILMWHNLKKTSP